METRKTRLIPNGYYHIYNRGVNGQNLFLEERNYTYFLDKYAQYVYPYFETYAYCLLKNHFHLLVRAKPESEIRVLLKEKHTNKDITWVLGNAFASLFKSYTQAVNKAYDRTGRLFEEPFHRIEVESSAYFSQLVGYIHHNPQKHGFTNDFRTYAHSSYQSFLHDKPTKLMRADVLQWFGTKAKYSEFHLQNIQHDLIKNMVIEF